jgi:predicted negative regulator of RcsB-dependent stress response
VDEYLTEKEQLDRIKQWWHENGWFLVGGMAIAVTGYFGYNQYQAYRDARAEAAADLFITLQQTIEDDRGGADELLAQLRAEHPDSPYTHHASLLMARELLITNPARAADELRSVMVDSDDPGLAFIARLRLARVLAYQESYAEALGVLSVPDAGQFAARLNEIKGDIHAAMGETEAARTAYTQALTAPGAESVDRNFVQMKLNDLRAAPGAGSAEDDA